MREQVTITDEDEWYCSLPPKEKEEVAYYILKHYQLDREDDPIDYRYPECTIIWLAMDNLHKIEVFNHYTQCKTQ